MAILRMGRDRPHPLLVCGAEMTETPSARSMEIGRTIGDQILADVTDRKGWRHAWDMFDDDVQEEVREAFTLIAARLLDAEFAKEREAAWRAVRFEVGHLLAEIEDAEEHGEGAHDDACPICRQMQVVDRLIRAGAPPAPDRAGEAGSRT